MLKLKVKELSPYKKNIEFVNPNCGHKNVFEYNTPYMCTDKFCTALLPKVHKLCEPENQSLRVKYFKGEKIE